jgi:hypothetical protein
MRPTFRIAIWAVAGALIAALWSLAYLPKMSRVGFLLADISCPIVLLGHTHNISFAAALITNALTYALMGLALGTMRRVKSRLG